MTIAPPPGSPFSPRPFDPTIHPSDHERQELARAVQEMKRRSGPWQPYDHSRLSPRTLEQQLENMKAMAAREAAIVKVMEYLTAQSLLQIWGEDSMAKQIYEIIISAGLNALMNPKEPL